MDTETTSIIYNQEEIRMQLESIWDIIHEKQEDYDFKITYHTLEEDAFYLEQLRGYQQLLESLTPNISDKKFPNINVPNINLLSHEIGSYLQTLFYTQEELEKLERDQMMMNMKMKMMMINIDENIG